MKVLEAVLKHKTVASATLLMCGILVAVGVFAGVITLEETQSNDLESRNQVNRVETVVTGQEADGIMTVTGQTLQNVNKAILDYNVGLEVLQSDLEDRMTRREVAMDESRLQVATEDLNLLTVQKVVVGGIKDKTGQLIEEASYEPVAVYESPFTAYSDEDYDALLRIVEAEATSEDMIGKIMVANVVINRVNSSGFPGSLYDVIHQQTEGGVYQFSPIKDGRYFTVPVTDSTVEAVSRALSGEDYSNGALFFVARTLASDNAVSWFDRNLEKVAEHGVHEFFAYPSN